jgi:HAD superfamily hydrolase (TIGR01509 family)
LTAYFDKNGLWSDDQPQATRHAFVRALKLQKDHHFLDVIAEATAFTCRPGIVRIIREAFSMEGQVAVVSNTTTDVVLKQLELLLPKELLGRIHVFGGEQASKKPSGALYLLAAKSLGLSEKLDKIVVVEDSAQGVSAALSAGIRKVVVTKSLFTQAHDFSGAMLVLHDLNSFCLEGKTETSSLKKDHSFPHSSSLFSLRSFISPL